MELKFYYISPGKWTLKTLILPVKYGKDAYMTMEEKWDGFIKSHGPGPAQ